MKNKKRSSGSRYFTISLILAIAIAFCVVSLLVEFNYNLSYDNDRFNETLFIPQEEIGTVDKELEKLIREYHPESIKGIEIYTEDFELAFRISFDDNGDELEYMNDIRDYPELMTYLKQNEEGHTFYKINDTETDLYFRWYMVQAHDSDTKHLVLIFSTRPEAGFPWYTIRAYVILVLVFIMILLGVKERHENNMKQFDQNQQEIENMYNEYKE